MSTINELMKTLAAKKRAMDTAVTKASAAKKAYDEAQANVLGELNAQKLESAKSGKVSASTYTQETYEVTDWDKYYQMISKAKAWDLLQKRASTTAIRDRLAAGQKLPVKLVKIRKLRVSVAK